MNNHTFFYTGFNNFKQASAINAWRYDNQINIDGCIAKMSEII